MFSGMSILSTPSLGITSPGGPVTYLPIRNNFQLPLSGSPNSVRLNDSYEQEFSFQLPLSGSQGPIRLGSRHRQLQQPFNSLSRDHYISLGIIRPPPPLGPAFNSLSRDHSGAAKLSCRRAFGLSTPSLGITRKGAMNASVNAAPAFNSLSRDHKIVRAYVAQLENVLSTPSLGITIGDFWRITLRISVSLSTPSLGITWTTKYQQLVETLKSFNSLSRDHGITGINKSAAHPVSLCTFQLPLSGSR